MVVNDLTQERLKELLHYDPETGIWTWIIKPHYTRPDSIGKRAGWFHHEGYRYIKIDNKTHKESRLVFLYMNGEWPKGEVHHKNHITDDNRRDNLDDVSHLDNMKDQVKYKNNTSGYKGVSWNKWRKKWRAKITVNKKIIILGYFDTPEEAHAVYCEEALKYFGRFANFG